MNGYLLREDVHRRQLRQAAKEMSHALGDLRRTEADLKKLLLPSATDPIKGRHTKFKEYLSQVQRQIRALEKDMDVVSNLQDAERRKYGNQREKHEPLQDATSNLAKGIDGIKRELGALRPAVQSLEVAVKKVGAQARSAASKEAEARQAAEGIDAQGRVLTSAKDGYFFLKVAKTIMTDVSSARSLVGKIILGLRAVIGLLKDLILWLGKKLLKGAWHGLCELLKTLIPKAEGLIALVSSIGDLVVDLAGIALSLTILGIPGGWAAVGTIITEGAQLCHDVRAIAARYAAYEQSKLKAMCQDLRKTLADLISSFKCAMQDMHQACKHISKYHQCIEAEGRA